MIVSRCDGRDGRGKSTMIAGTRVSADTSEAMMPRPVYRPNTRMGSMSMKHSDHIPATVVSPAAMTLPASPTMVASSALGPGPNSSACW